ncbi:hypothetical protein N7493_005757 [Penicillium malachiteum]|uniref:Aminotransferase class I/classII domain-containing protein n=1 Tax=Penicillium malachiteum TaxID=1324776 RepID=A0AAD6HNA2_9EURO|nr:hypothetical protein N7493_005757 [Penicillium malachiteum]
MQSLKRRQKILEIAEDHDLIIIEDHPYYFLRPGFCSKTEVSDISAGGVPSYLSLDTSGTNDSIIEKFLAYQEVSTVAVSGPVQMMLYKLLDERYLYLGDYGMFLWVELDWRKHPQLKDELSHEILGLTLLEIEDNILQLALEDGVQVTKGSLFHCSKKPTEELHFRMTFAAASEEDLTEGVKIFADSIKKEFCI